MGETPPHQVAAVSTWQGWEPLHVTLNHFLQRGKVVGHSSLSCYRLFLQHSKEGLLSSHVLTRQHWGASLNLFFTGEPFEPGTRVLVFGGDFGPLPRYP